VRTGAQVAEARKRAERRARWVWRGLGYVTFLAVWQFTSTFLVQDFILPPPGVIAEEMWSIITSDQLLTHFAATLKNIAIGFAIAFLIGTVIGIAMGTSRWWEAFLGDWVMVTLTTPGLVFALVCAMIFGLNELGPIVCVIVTAYSYIAVAVRDVAAHRPDPVLDRLPGGLAGLDPAPADAARPDPRRGGGVHVGRDPRRHARPTDRL
jgi:NitT/TauT family transport system permease protein